MPEKLKWTTLACCLAVAFSPSSSADAADSTSPKADHPTIGMVYGQREDRSITYDCKVAPAGDTLTCDFVQSSVRLKSRPDQWPAALAKAEKEWDEKSPENRKKEAEQICKMSEELLPILEGKKAAPAPEKFAALGEQEKSAMKKMATLSGMLCGPVSKTKWIDMIKGGFDMEARTCVVASDHWTQKFKRQRALTQEAAVWVADSSADGDCGIVRLDRWESEKLGASYFWNFFSRKAVTNPSGSTLLIQCSQFDQTEYAHSWRSKTVFQQCDQIEFAPF